MKECPDYLEIEDEMGLGTNPIIARVSRAAAEATLGRRLRDREDFRCFMDTRRKTILHAALIARLSMRCRPVDEDHPLGAEWIVDLTAEEIKEA